jgi:hypothetical protein
MKKVFEKVKTNDVSFLTQAPTGIPGDCTRPDESNIEPGFLKLNGSSVLPLAYGIPLAAVAGGFASFTTSNVAADFQGVLVREVPFQGASSSSDTAFGGPTPNPFQVAGIMVRGYVNVVCQYGTPARDGVVYIRIAATSGSRILGGFEATNDAGNNVALSSTQAVWASDGMDANNNAELRVAR